jgi:hypothetical protein
MAIDSKLPKGPSNSAGMGATPGTQQTAANNLATGGFNPNMPMANQVSKQARSSYQQGLARSQGRPTMPRPRPTPRPATPVRQTGRPVLSRGMPMDPGRGYNVFSGMDASEISQMNQSMGLSNMTSLPSPSVGSGAGFGLKPGRPMSMQLMDTEYESSDGTSHFFDKSSNTVKVGDSYETAVTMDYEDYLNEYGDEAGNYVADMVKEDQEQDLEQYAEETTGEDLLGDTLIDIIENKPGYSDEELEEVENMLDQKYANQLQALLMGIDRQAAMMGTFGSGAHSMSINNATAQALTAMADEYAQLGMADLEKYESDLQQSIINKLSIFDRLIANNDFTDEKSVEELLNLEKFLTGTDESPVSSYIANELSQIAPTGHHQFYGMLAELGNQVFTDLANGEITEIEAIQKYKNLSTKLMKALTAYAAYSGDGKLTVEDPNIPGQTISVDNEVAVGAVQSLFDEFFEEAGIYPDGFTVSYV